MSEQAFCSALRYFSQRPFDTLRAARNNPSIQGISYSQEFFDLKELLSISYYLLPISIF
jgi:hypothetical protein